MFRSNVHIVHKAQSGIINKHSNQRKTNICTLTLCVERLSGIYSQFDTLVILALHIVSKTYLPDFFSIILFHEIPFYSSFCLPISLQRALTNSWNFHQTALIECIRFSHLCGSDEFQKQSLSKLVFLCRSVTLFLCILKPQSDNGTVAWRDGTFIEYAEHIWFAWIMHDIFGRASHLDYELRSTKCRTEDKEPCHYCPNLSWKCEDAILILSSKYTQNDKTYGNFDYSNEQTVLCDLHSEYFAFLTVVNEDVVRFQESIARCIQQ